MNDEEIRRLAERIRNAGAMAPDAADAAIPLLTEVVAQQAPAGAAADAAVPDELEDRIVERVFERLRESVEPAIREAVREAVREAIEAQRSGSPPPL